MSSEEKKFRNSIIFWVAVIGFVMSLLGNVVSQSFIAGGITKTLDTAVKNIDDIKDDLNQNYLKKETFYTYKEGKDRELNTTNDRLTEIIDKLNSVEKYLREKR